MGVYRVSLQAMGCVYMYIYIYIGEYMYIAYKVIYIYMVTPPQDAY